VIERGAHTSEWGILASNEEEDQPAIEDDLFDEDEDQDDDESDNEGQAEDPGVGPAVAHG